MKYYSEDQLHHAYTTFHHAYYYIFRHVFSSPLNQNIIIKVRYEQGYHV